MAKLYGKLKGLAKSSESQPIVPLTKQKWSDVPFIIRGKDRCIPAWHYILVPHYKINHLNSQTSGENIDCTSFGPIIKYRDHTNKILSVSGWGTDPPRAIKKWFSKHFDCKSVDENTKLDYECDDIRLCTMQRLTREQKMGISRFYHKQENFHYIILSNNNDQSSLAYRSGIRNFDRFICLNGINIEHETIEQITERFNNQLDLPVQILVCSPATYQHYKSNKMSLHDHLLTIQHLKPVFDISITKENISPSINSLLDKNFYVVQLENSESICVVSQLSIFKSPELIHINDICFIEIEEHYRRGKIQFKGSKDQCEKFQIDFLTESLDNTADCRSNDGKLLSDSNPNANILLNETISNDRSQLEDLPNELLFDLFNYLTIEDLHNAFNNLNIRFTNLLVSCQNMSLIFDENTNLSLMKIYAFQIAHLTIEALHECDLEQFSNLHSLILCNRHLNHIKQILPEILPNLVNLSFLLESDFKAPLQLINQIFSNQFPCLRHVNLGCIDKPCHKLWSISPSIQFVSIRSDNSMIFPDILLSCPNLYYFQFHIRLNSNVINDCSSIFFHPLKRFTLWSDEVELSFDLIDNLISYIPSIEHLYLQTKCRISLLQLVQNLYNRLQYLSRFNCFIKELIMQNDRIDLLNDIYQISSCFNRIQCLKETEDFRIFATD